MPMPSSALPASDMIVRTSAKSRLIRPGQRHQVGDALHALAQHVVGDAEGLDHRRVAIEHRQQPVVRDHDQRVDLLAERGDPGLSLVATARALELERTRDDADRQRAELAGDLRNHRRGARAGAAAGAGRDEHHVGAAQHGLDLVVLLARRLAAELRVGSRAEPAGDRVADVQGRRRGRGLQRLQIGVDRDELDALDVGLDHAVDGVDAGTADADDADHRASDRPRRRMRLLEDHVGARVDVVQRGHGLLRPALGRRAGSIRLAGMSAAERRLEALLRGRHAGLARLASADARRCSGKPLRRPRDRRHAAMDAGSARRSDAGSATAGARLRASSAGWSWRRCPRRSCGRAGTAVPRACSRA